MQETDSIDQPNLTVELPQIESDRDFESMQIQDAPKAETEDKYTNRKRAILFINLFALTIPAIGMVFRKAVENGVSTLDFSLSRGWVLFFTMSIINLYKK